MKTFKVSNLAHTNDIEIWVLQNNMAGKISYDWIKHHIAFEHESDATAFSLRFGLRPVETKLEAMLKSME